MRNRRRQDQLAQDWADR